MTMAKKYVYFFGGKQTEGKGDEKTLLGGKGAGLAQMCNIGLPVPPGFTLTTETCASYYSAGKKWPVGLAKQVKANVAKLEKMQGKKLGDPKDPLLVSVRSGAALSMPGMMETILNLGLNDISVEGLAAKTGNQQFAYDAYRRFIQMYAATAMGLSKDEFEHPLEELKATVTAKRLKRKKGEAVADMDVSGDEFKQLCETLKAKYQKMTGKAFPQDPWDQLVGSINAVFNSWMADKAITYRRVEKISERDVIGTGVNICTMVYGNMGETSGTGVAFTRDPNTGRNTFYGDYLFNAQGEDVVAGIRTPVRLSELKRKQPKVYKQLDKVRQTLEKNYKDMQDIEFTVQEGTLYMLQTRRGKRTPQATFKIACDLVKEGLISEKEAVSRIEPEDIERLFYPEINPNADAAELQKSFVAEGIAAVPGAAAGRVCFTAAKSEAEAAKGERVILVRKETIVGCDSLNIDYKKGRMTVKGAGTIKEGDYITLNGNTGAVHKADLPLVDPKPSSDFKKLMKWVDAIREIDVRTNADTPEDSAKAIEMGAEGIGLCRTEHMFFETQERIDAIREMILAEEVDVRRAALKKLLPFQRKDFEGIFKVMKGRPVTIRLLDPPLHEFVPHDAKNQSALAKKLGLKASYVKQRVEQLHEFNPMLGHRGCRLSITYPEILEMQTQAVMEAACNVKKKGGKVNPEIMIPLVIDARELSILADRVHAVAAEVLKKKKMTKKQVPYLVGTMIEIPRAALMAHEIAEVAEFFSFGTNDLTQTCMGLSRDDAGRFLPDYVDESKAAVFMADPFQVLDQAGVGQLVELGIERGRKTRKKLKVGICGEHGGERDSVKFCVRQGMNYVSCSPYRVPIARLAAAQAAIEG
jgi:pyruvate,orthophosphate dikinase